jgi:hypothetical protein
MFTSWRHRHIYIYMYVCMYVALFHWNTELKFSAGPCTKFRAIPPHDPSIHSSIHPSLNFLSYISRVALKKCKWAWRRHNEDNPVSLKLQKCQNLRLWKLNEHKWEAPRGHLKPLPFISLHCQRCLQSSCTLPDS